MKKEVGGLLSFILSLSLVSAQQLTDMIDSFVQEVGVQSLLLVVIFLSLFAVIFYSLKKVFPDTKSVPAVIAASIGLIAAYGIVQMNVGLEGYYYDLTDYLAISGGLVLGILPIALLVTMLVFWPYLPVILVGIGTLFVILSYFAYASAFVMIAGLFCIGLGIVSWFAIRAMLNPSNNSGKILKLLGVIAIGIPIILVGYSFGGFLGAILGVLFIGLAITRRFGVIGAGILGFAAVSCGFFIADWGGAVVVFILVVLILMGKSGLKDAYGVTKSGWNQATFNGGDFKKKEINLEQDEAKANQVLNAAKERKQALDQQIIRDVQREKQDIESLNEAKKRENDLKKEYAQLNDRFEQLRKEFDLQSSQGKPDPNLLQELEKMRKIASEFQSENKKLHDRIIQIEQDIQRARQEEQAAKLEEEALRKQEAEAEEKIKQEENERKKLLNVERAQKGKITKLSNELNDLLRRKAYIENLISRYKENNSPVSKNTFDDLRKVELRISVVQRDLQNLTRG